MADDDDHQPSQLRSFLMLLGICLLILGGWFLTQRLIANSRVEDCLMSGRKNCAPIDAQGNIQPPK